MCLNAQVFASLVQKGFEDGSPNSRKGQTSGETASRAPSADKGLDKALWEPLVRQRNRGGAGGEQQGRGKDGKVVLPSRPGCRPQVAYTPKWSHR